jgi:hypothetical protein
LGYSTAFQRDRHARRQRCLKKIAGSGEHGSTSLPNCVDAAFSIGRPKFSLEPTENVRLHGIGIDGDYFNMGTFTALKCAQAERCARA